MKKIFILLALLFYVLTAFSQKNNFGIINYTVPPGYELINNENVLTYSKENKSTGAFCNIFIYKMMPGHGGVQQDFDFAWTNLVQAPFKVTGNANMQPAGILKGWNLLLGTTIYNDNGVNTMALLSTFSGENNMQNVCILSNSDAYKTDIENFIASVDVSKDIKVSSSTQSIATNATPAQSNNSVVGIWTFSDRKKLAGTYAMTFTAFSRGYKFNPDGTYWYYNKIYTRGATNLNFHYETGIWKVNGSQLIITPIKGQNEEWSKKGKDADLLGEEWGTRLKTIARKLETITYTFEKRTLPGDSKTIHLMLKYDKPTERDKAFTYDNGQWRYAPFDPEANALPPGFNMNEGSNAATVRGNTTSAKTNALSSNAKYDLWMAYRFDLGGKPGDKKAYYVVLSSDNRCLFYFPEKGLYNLEQDFPASGNRWGNVTDKGDRLELKNARYGEMKLYKHSNGMGQYPDSKPFDYYKKCKPVNGIRVEGAYSPDVSLYKNKATVLDKVMYDPNKRPVIFFKKDGTYINEGIEFSNLTFGDNFAIGKGTYELKDFSLILTTQSGRKLQVSFAGILDANPVNSSDGYIINNNLFYKLDNSYQPH